MSDTDPRFIPSPPVVERNLALGHAMQTGVALTQAAGKQDGSPKHLRVGVNMAMCETAALQRILIEKGVIANVDEFLEVANKVLEEEVARYEAETGTRLA